MATATSFALALPCLTTNIVCSELTIEKCNNGTFLISLHLCERNNPTKKKTRTFSPLFFSFGGVFGAFYLAYKSNLVDYIQYRFARAFEEL